MDEENRQNLVSREIMIIKGNSIKSGMPGVSDSQALKIVEASYIIELCKIVKSSHPARIPSLQLLGLVFEDFEEEIFAEPPTLAFTGLPASGEEGITTKLAEEALAVVRQIGSMRVSRINAQNPSTASTETPSVMNQPQPKGSSDSKSQARAFEASSGSSTVPVKMAEANLMVGSDNKAEIRAVKSSASSNEASQSITEANPMFSSNTKAQDRLFKSSGVPSRIPVTMAKAKPMVGSDSKIQRDAVEPSASSTKARLDWQQSERGDPFGVRVSTEELGTMPPPFELAVTGRFNNTRENIMYLAGCREVTTHCEELPPHITQPLQPGVDLTPEPVKAFMAVNTGRKEATEAEMKAAKAKELNVVEAQEITTARGLREDFNNVDPTYAETMFVALAAARLEPTQVGAYNKLTNESMREIRAELKARGGVYTSFLMEEEDAPAKSYVHPSADAPTEEDEAPLKSWIEPVADRVIDKAQMHYDMMYEIATQMQRDRLNLGPEVSDYEVIATAHASYIATDKAEAARLARAAETQKTKALSCSVGDELRKAQVAGLPITRIGGLELTQKDIADVLERCDQVGASAAAANDYLAAKNTDFKDFHDDPFTRPEHLNPLAAATPFTIKDLVSGASAGIAEHRAAPPVPPPPPAPGRFTAAVEQIERDLVAMKAFRSRIGTTPRDFASDIEEIEMELAELKAHRAEAPGDLVSDSVDGSEGGIGVGVGIGDGDGGEGDGVENLEETAAVPKKAKSRAEQRRAARQKAKGKGKEKE